MGLFNFGSKPKQKPIPFEEAAKVFGFQTNEFFKKGVNIQYICPNKSKEYVENAFLGAVLGINLYNQYKNIKTERFTEFATIAAKMLLGLRNTTKENGQILLDVFNSMFKETLDQKISIKEYATKATLAFMVKVQAPNATDFNIIQQLENNLIKSINLTSNFFDVYYIEY